MFEILGRVTMEGLIEKVPDLLQFINGLSQRVLKDTTEQLDKEIHRARSRRVLNTGASVPVKFGMYLPPSCTGMHFGSPTWKVH